MVDSRQQVGHKNGMTFIPEYRPGHKEFAARVAQVQWLGLIPVFLSLLLIWAAPDKPGPGLWSAFGTALGFSLILHGARRLVQYPGQATAWGQRRAMSAERWFPGFLFAIQSGLATVTALLLWFSLGDLGLQHSALSTGLLYFLLILYPAHRLSRELVRGREEVSYQTLEVCLRYLKRGLTAILVAMVFTGMAREGGASISEPMLIAVITVWAVAALMALIGLVFILERLLARPKPGQSG